MDRQAIRLQLMKSLPAGCSNFLNKGLFLCMMNLTLTILLAFILFSPPGLSQTLQPAKSFVMMSYNVENLFDTINDPHTADDAFTPTGKNHWDTKKYLHKLAGIARVIGTIVPQSFPDFVVLCEVENQQVLTDLIRQKDLEAAHYQIIFRKSRDSRGISTGMLYRTGKFRVLSWRLIGVDYPGEKQEHNRGILYVKGIVFKSDTVHIFGNHWKSRIETIAETEPKRIYEAGILKSKTDSIFRRNRNARIVCLGDFNDEPSDNSINMVLGATCAENPPATGKLVDVMCLPHLQGKGTYSFRGHWLMLDNIIVSRSLLLKKSRIHLDGVQGHIYAPKWLLKANPKANDAIPWKTYAGDKYLGGYSDHLPVYVVLHRR